MPLQPVDVKTLLTQLQIIEWVLLNCGSEEFGPIYWQALRDGVKRAQALLPDDPALAADLEPSDVRNFVDFLDELVISYRLDAEEETLNVPADPRDADRARWLIRLAVEREEPAGNQPDSTGQTDKKTDKKKSRKLLIPRDKDVLKLAKKIRTEKTRQNSKRDLALEFTDGDEQRAEKLLRQLQPSRYGYLLKPPDQRADK